MDNPQVNIYIETSVHGPAQRGGCCMYIMEYILPSGVPRTVRGGSGWRDKKETELVLQALAAALARIKSPCVIDLYTSCLLVRGAIENGWPDRWRQQGWKNAKGKEISHRELWERITELAEPHLIFTSGEPHSYQKWMQSELRKQNDRSEKESKVE